jgi:hypothetical protein
MDNKSQKLPEPTFKIPEYKLKVKDVTDTLVALPNLAELMHKYAPSRTYTATIYIDTVESDGALGLKPTMVAFSTSLSPYDVGGQRADGNIGKGDYNLPFHTIGAGATQAEHAGRAWLHKQLSDTLELFADPRYQPSTPRDNHRRLFGTTLEEIKRIYNNPETISMRFAYGTSTPFINKEVSKLVERLPQDDFLWNQIHQMLDSEAGDSRSPVYQYAIVVTNFKDVPQSYIPHLHANYLLSYYASRVGLDPKQYAGSQDSKTFAQTMATLGTNIVDILKWGRDNLLNPIKRRLEKAKHQPARKDQSQGAYRAYLVSIPHFQDMLREEIEKQIKKDPPNRRMALWFIGLTQINLLPSEQIDAPNTLLSFNLLYDSVNGAIDIIRSATNTGKNQMPSVIRSATGIHEAMTLLRNAGQNVVYISLLQPFIAYYESRRWSGRQENRRRYKEAQGLLEQAIKEKDLKKANNLFKMFTRNKGWFGWSGQANFLYLTDENDEQMPPISYAQLVDDFKNLALAPSTERLMDEAYQIKREVDQILEKYKPKNPQVLDELQLFSERLGKLLDGNISIREIGKLETQVEKVPIPLADKKLQEGLQERLRNFTKILESQEYLLDSIHAVVPDVLPRSTMELLGVGTKLREYSSNTRFPPFLFGIPQFMIASWKDVFEEAEEAGIAAARTKYEELKTDTTKSPLEKLIEIGKAAWNAAKLPMTQEISALGDTGDIILTAIPRGISSKIYEELLGGNYAGMSFYQHTALYGNNWTERYLGRWRETGRLIPWLGEGTGEFMGIMVLSMADPMQWAIDIASLLASGGASIAARGLSRLAGTAGKLGTVARGTRVASRALNLLSRSRNLVRTSHYTITPLVEKSVPALRLGFRAGKNLINIGYITARGWGDFGDFFDAYVMSDGDWSTVLFAMFSDFEYMTRSRKYYEAIKTRGLRGLPEAIQQLPGLAPFFGTFEPHKRVIASIWDDVQQFHSVMNNPYGRYVRGFLELKNQVSDLLSGDTTPYENQTVWYRSGTPDWQIGKIKKVLGNRVEIETTQGKTDYISPSDVIVDLTSKIKDNSAAWEHIPTAYLYHALRIINKGNITPEMLNHLYGQEISSKLQLILVQTGLATLTNNEFVLTANGRTLLQTIDNPSDRTVQHILEKLFLQRFGNEKTAQREARAFVEKIKNLRPEEQQLLKRAIVNRYLHLVSRGIQNIIKNLPMSVYIGKTDGFEQLTQATRDIKNGEYYLHAIAKSGPLQDISERLIVRTPKDNEGALPDIELIQKFVEGMVSSWNDGVRTFHAHPVGVREGQTEDNQPYWEIAFDISSTINPQMITILRQLGDLSEMSEETPILGTNAKPNEKTLRSLNLLIAQTNNDIKKIRTQYKNSQIEDPYGYGLLYALSDILAEQEAEQFTPTTTEEALTAHVSTGLDTIRNIIELEHTKLVEEYQKQIRQLEEEKRQLIETIKSLQRQLPQSPEEKKRGSPFQQQQLAGEQQRLKETETKLKILRRQFRRQFKTFEGRVRSILSELRTYGIHDPNIFPIPLVDRATALGHFFNNAINYANPEPLVPESFSPTIKRLVSPTTVRLFSNIGLTVAIAGLTSMLPFIETPLIIPATPTIGRSVRKEWIKATTEAKANRMAKRIVGLLKDAPKTISDEIQTILQQVASGTLASPIAAMNELLARLSDRQTATAIMTALNQDITDVLPEAIRPQSRITLNDVLKTIVDAIEGDHANPYVTHTALAQYATTLAITEHLKDIIINETGMTPQEQESLQRSINIARLMALIAIANTTPKQTRDKIKEDLKQLGISPILMEKSERFTQEEYKKRLRKLFEAYPPTLPIKLYIESPDTTETVSDILEFHRTALWFGVNDAIIQFKTTKAYKAIASALRTPATMIVSHNIIENAFEFGKLIDSSAYLEPTQLQLIQTKQPTPDSEEETNLFLQAIAETILGLDFFHEIPNQRIQENYERIQNVRKRIAEAYNLAASSSQTNSDLLLAIISKTLLEVPLVIRGATERASLGPTSNPFPTLPTVIVSPGSILTIASLPEEALHTTIESLIQQARTDVETILQQQIDPNLPHKPPQNVIQDIKQSPSFITLIKSLGVIERWLNESDEFETRFERQVAHIQYMSMLAGKALETEELLIRFFLMKRFFETQNNPFEIATATLAMTMFQPHISEVSQRGIRDIQQLTRLFSRQGWQILFLSQVQRGQLRGRMQDEFQNYLEFQIRELSNRSVIDRLLEELGI